MVRVQVIVLLLLVCAHSLWAQEVKATARVDSNSILIGDPILLLIEVTYPSGTNITWPALNDPPKGFERLQQKEVETTKTETGMISSMAITLTAFESGTFHIPEFTFQYTSAGKIPQTVKTTPLSVTVKSVTVDTAGDIKDIKPPINMPYSWKEALPYAAVACGVVLLAWLIYYLIRKRKRGDKIIPSVAVPSRPPHEIALGSLKDLAEKRLWQQGMIKEYHSELTDILRTYMEGRYEIPAMEMITAEILNTSRLMSLKTELRDNLQQILETADLVKFAKFYPLPQDNERSMSIARSFVERTINDAAPAKQGLAEAIA